MKQSIRAILELIGLLESAETIVKRKLGTVSQAKRKGPVTVLVRDIGPMRISAMTAIRRLTGLDLEDVLVFEDLLPWPLLRNVSVETAVEAKQLLEELGVSVQLTGIPGQTIATKSEALPVDGEQSESSESGLPAGDYVVRLVSVGLLPDRVVERLQKFGRLSPEQATAIVESVPQVVVEGVDETSALRIQRELQMVSAAVDVLKKDG